MLSLSILPAGIRHLKQCPGKALLPAAAGSAVKGYMGSQILPYSSYVLFLPAFRCSIFLASYSVIQVMSIMKSERYIDETFQNILLQSYTKFRIAQ